MEINQLLSSAGSITGSAIDGILIGLLIFVAISPLIIVYWIMGYKYSITVRHVTGGKLIISKDRGKVVKDQKGVEKIKFLKTPIFMKSDKIAMPPDEVLLTTPKGKKHFDVYRTSNGQYIFIKDKGLDEKITIPKDKAQSEFEPLNTMDRDYYANEWEEAEKYKKKSITQFLLDLAPWVIIFLMFTMLIINWDAIAAPALQSQQESLKMQQENTKLIKEIQKTAAIMGQIQIAEDANFEDEQNTNG